MSDLRSSNEFVLVNDNTTNDVIYNKKVTGRVETLQKIDIQTDYSLFNVADMPPLPNVGEWVESGNMYTDGVLNWNCIQSHNMTAFPPIDTPALFRQYRLQGAAWVQPQDEWDAYYLGDWVSFTDGKYYKTNLDVNVWSPSATPQYWDECDEYGEVIPAPPEVIPIWSQPTGSEDAYNTGDKVYFPTELDPIYESLIDANTYSPTAYPAGWLQVT